MKQLTIIFLYLFFSISLSAQDRPTVRYSKKAGVYEFGIQVALEANVSDARIYYTLDGTTPTSKSILYSRPIRLNKTAVIKVIAKTSKQSSLVYTSTYFIGEKTDFMLTSLSLPPAILFDEVEGWFNEGEDVIDTSMAKTGANFWSRKEEKAYIELFEENGDLVYSDRVGLKLFGGMSRLFPQKSFAIAARTVYSDNAIRYPLFPDKKNKKYKHFVLRNAGSDAEKAHFRDAFMTSLMTETGIEKQAYRPTLLFINGAYWGIYYIREKVNKRFIEDNCGVESDSIDLIEHRMSLKHGSLKHYQAMLRFIENNDLSRSENYEYIQSQMDVDNFMTYQIAQIFFDNQDAGGNIKFWRPNTPEGRWRWILYDTDWGFGLQERDAYQFNSLAFHTAEDGPDWPNPPWSTFILRNLLKNENFKKDFILKYTDYLNWVFESNRMISRIDSFQQMLNPEIARHHQRWDLRPNIWQNHIKRMKIFAEKRPDFVRQFLKTKFALGEIVTLEVSVSKGGQVLINQNIPITAKKDFEGQYFKDFSIRLRAIPNYGYQFSHWKMPNGNSSREEIEVKLSDVNQYRAIFSSSVTSLESQIIFNEICPAHKAAGDWVELYNLTDKNINLKGWTFRDAIHSFELPSAILKAKGHLILCQDTMKFKKQHPEVLNIIGDFPFGLSKKSERLYLFSAQNAPVDSVVYQVEPPDSVFVLALPHPNLENQETANWELITDSGTPSQHNPSYHTIEKTQQQKATFKWFMLGGLLLVLLFFISRVRRNKRR